MAADAPVPHPPPALRRGPPPPPTRGRGGGRKQKWPPAPPSPTPPPLWGGPLPPPRNGRGEGNVLALIVRLHYAPPTHPGRQKCARDNAIAARSATGSRASRCITPC